MTVAGAVGSDISAPGKSGPPSMKSSGPDVNQQPLARQLRCDRGSVRLSLDGIGLTISRSGFGLRLGLPACTTGSVLIHWQIRQRILCQRLRPGRPGLLVRLELLLLGARRG